jgi:hypothetical protein
MKLRHFTAGVVITALAGVGFSACGGAGSVTFQGHEAYAPPVKNDGSGPPPDSSGFICSALGDCDFWLCECADGTIVAASVCENGFCLNAEGACTVACDFFGHGNYGGSAQGGPGSGIGGPGDGGGGAGGGGGGGTCGADGDSCSSDDECCSATCDAGFCGSGSCGADGDSCISDADCCSSPCGSDGTCGGSTCLDAGGFCSSDSDCCSFFCDVDTCQ